MNKKKKNDMANDVADKVAQQKLKNNKCYPLAFKYISKLETSSLLVWWGACIKFWLMC